MRTAGDLAGESPETEWMSGLKDLEASQIAEIFDGFCYECHALLKSRLLALTNKKHVGESGNVDSSPFSSSETSTAPAPAPAPGPAPVNTNQQLSNHDRALSKESDDSKSSPSLIHGKPQVRDLFSPNLFSGVGNYGPSVTVSHAKSEEEEDEWRRFSQVGRKKNFVHNERVNGKVINVLQGLELHTGVFSPEEQKKIVESVYEYQRMGRKGELMGKYMLLISLIKTNASDYLIVVTKTWSCKLSFLIISDSSVVRKEPRTYSEPRKWMRGKGRVTIQFGCCYNYAVDKDGNPPGIIRDEEVDPLPPVFKQMIKRMVKWHVLPPTCVPNSCIVNIYDEGDCIPPHIDHHDFLRPFCTVSFLTECNILFGLNLKVSGAGDFSGPICIPLPVGSVLVLKGNGADVAKHCVPAVPAKRISVTFRRMDESKIPYNFLPDPELQNLKPLVRPSLGTKAAVAAQDQHQHEANKISGKARMWKPREPVDNAFVLQTNDFPPLGGLKL
ncbi:hypothetical protein Cgig2_016018 [Carnegiea gigantea]|uniref:Fe2OG dioxygenase domain-containing protein n=1 Tax=Carnegiea gigantea TaxID=171969 RepID=A0A9Q1QL07_9CARY|nr:hypothetical protein Cgig2_016018 [Carnegiea gigantea]